MQGLRISTLIAACAVGAGGLMPVMERFAGNYIFGLSGDHEQAMRVIYLYWLTSGLLVHGGLCTFFLALLIANGPLRNSGAPIGDQTMSLLRVATLIALIASALMGVWSASFQVLRILAPDNTDIFRSPALPLIWMALSTFLYGALVFFFVTLFIKQGPQRTHAAYRGYGTHE